MELEAPRLVDGPALLIAGLGDRFNQQTNVGIPALWQRFGPHIGRVPGQVGWTTYGICHGADGTGSFEYLCGVEVTDLAGVPPELARLTLPARRYAVFTHRGHISALRATIQAIWRDYLPASGLKVANAPDFERYDDRFDPQTGSGVVEIWIPVAG